MLPEKQDRQGRIAVICRRSQDDKLSFLQHPYKRQRRPPVVTRRQMESKTSDARVRREPEQEDPEV